MSVMLVAADFDWFLDVHLDDVLLDALLTQIERGKAKPVASRSFHRRLESTVPEAIGAALDGDLRPPSEQQRQFAERIASRLSLEVPAEAWRYRTEMGTFIEGCVDQLRDGQRATTSKRSRR